MLKALVNKHKDKIAEEAQQQQTQPTKGRRRKTILGDVHDFAEAAADLDVKKKCKFQN